jgi:hypothetical protein
MKINYRVMIAGIICLTAIYISLLIFDNKDNEIIQMMIIAIIALCVGVIVPSPRVDNRRGVLIW